MTKNINNTSKICGYDSDNISVRGKNLVTELIGKLSFTEMILLQMTGIMPNQDQTSIVDSVLVTIMEHGIVPSAMVSRLTYYGAPESFQGAVAAGLLGVGDRFAGTASECAQLLESIVKAPPTERAQVAQYLVSDYRAKNLTIPGFGHSMHKQTDPRVNRLISIVSSTDTSGDYVEALNLLEHEVQSQIPKNLVTNVSAAIAAALGEAGIPGEAMRGIIMTARCAGLAGHVCEEMQNPIGESLWRNGEQSITQDLEIDDIDKVIQRFP